MVEKALRGEKAVAAWRRKAVAVAAEAVIAAVAAVRQ